MALDPPLVIPAVNCVSFEDMLADEMTLTPGHQTQCLTFVDTVQGGLTSTPYKFHGEAMLPPRLVSQSHPEETGLHTAAQEFWKIQEPKISKL